MKWRLELEAGADWIIEPRVLLERWGAWVRSPSTSSGFVWLLSGGQLASVHAPRGLYPTASAFIYQAPREGMSLPVSGPPSGFRNYSTWVLIVHTASVGRWYRAGRRRRGVVIAACQPTLVGENVNEKQRGN